MVVYYSKDMSILMGMFHFVTPFMFQVLLLLPNAKWLIKNKLLFLKVALLNLVTISSTWARVIDVMTSEVSMLQETFICIFTYFFLKKLIFLCLQPVRFKIVWVCWCWCHTWATIWLTFCCRNGLAWSLYVCYQFIIIV